MLFMKQHINLSQYIFSKLVNLTDLISDIF